MEVNLSPIFASSFSISFLLLEPCWRKIFIWARTKTRSPNWLATAHDQIAFVPLWRLVAKDLASTGGGGGTRESLTG